MTFNINTVPRLVSSSKLARILDVSQPVINRRIGQGTLVPDFQSEGGVLLFREHRVPQIREMIHSKGAA